MSITFTTKINGVRTADVDGLTKVVKHVEYTIKGEDGGQTFELPNKVELNSADPNSFVEFADLTEATVAGWIESLESTASIKAHISFVVARMVAEAALATQPLPWAPPAPPAPEPGTLPTA